VALRATSQELCGCRSAELPDTNDATRQAQLRRAKSARAAYDGAMRTFAVSDVSRAVDPIVRVDTRVALEALARGAPLEAAYRTSRELVRAWGVRPSADDPTATVDVTYHPFVAAVHAAFDQHRPLILSPDAVWLMIAQGFALHVGANVEALRARIVAHEGRELIKVVRDDFVLGSPDNVWPGVFGELSEEVAARTGSLHALVVANFSTTDATSRAASELALLSTAQPYFAYQVHSMCGIPEITLEGTSDDWRSIRARVDGLRDYDAGWWVKALGPVLDQLVKAEAGDIDREFWSSLYKVKNASGGPYITGWINVLLPYVLDHRGQVTRNQAVMTWRDGLTAPFGGGPTTEYLPSGLAHVPFLWRYLTLEYRMEFLGGFAGVAQDPRTLALRPEIGWAVRPAV